MHDFLPVKYLSFPTNQVKMETASPRLGPSFRWHRISIAALLFLNFCVAGFLTGSRMGFQFGLSESLDFRVDELFRQRDRVLYPITCSVRDLVDSRAKPLDNLFAQLVAEIKTSVASKEWEANGGDCNIQPYQQNLSLVILPPRKDLFLSDLPKSDHRLAIIAGNQSSQRDGLKNVRELPIHGDSCDKVA